MGKTHKRRVRRQRITEHADYLEQLNLLYGHRQNKRDVFGRRAALPSEIARQLEQNRLGQKDPTQHEDLR